MYLFVSLTHILTQLENIKKAKKMITKTHYFLGKNHPPGNLISRK
jgi:hypothetical protein